jgi:CheY-like chemotaxis protein
VADATDAAARLVAGLGELQLQGLAHLARRLAALVAEPNAGSTVAIEIAEAVEDVRTMLASAVAQVESSGSLSGAILALGEPSASFDATLWVLSHHGHEVRHSTSALPDLDEPPDVILVNVGSDPRAAVDTTLRAVEETYRSPVVAFHEDLPVHAQATLARHCSTLLPLATSPTLVAEEIIRLRAAMSAELRATVWGCPGAVAVLRSHGFVVTEIDTYDELDMSAFGSLVLGEASGRRRMHEATRLVRVSMGCRRTPIVWQAPLVGAGALAAAQLGVRVVDEFDDAAASALSSELRRAATETDPTHRLDDAVLHWSAARLLIDRTLITAQRANTSCVVAAVHLPVDSSADRLADVEAMLAREFRRGDVVGRGAERGYVVALQGIGHRVGMDRLSGLLSRLGSDARIGVAEFPSAGRSAEELSRAASDAVERSMLVDGPAVVSTSWRPAEARHADIVIVDNDVVLGEMLRVAFEGRGLRARVETDTLDVLAQLSAATAEELPRLLMLDIDYGGAAGRSLLSALQPTGLLAHIKVLAVGSRAAESDIRMALDMGATDVIRKPFPITLLLHRVKQMLAS